MFTQQQTFTANRTATVAATGLVAIDEHTSVACLIDEVTPTGLSLTLLDTRDVPASFVLFLGAEARVCRVVRRSEEGIEAAFADCGARDRTARMSVPTARTGFAHAPRRFANAQGLRRAA